MVISLLYLVLLVGPTAPAKSKSVRPTAVLTVAPAPRPSTFVFTMLIRDPDRQIRCPSEVAWSWLRNSEKSGFSYAQADCDPYKLLESVQAFWSFHNTVGFPAGGEYNMTACVRGMLATICASKTVFATGYIQ